MSTPNLIAQHSFATAEACRKARTPGIAHDFVENGTPTKKILTNNTEQNSATTNKMKTDSILLDACMLRASTKTVLREQSDELHFLEGKIAALENIERQNANRNVSFWVEVFRSAGKDHVLRREGAESIQHTWRSYKCRQKLRCAIVSVTRCPTCNIRAQIPQRPIVDPPFVNFVSKFRCAGCQNTITTTVSPWWREWISGFDALINNNSTTGETPKDGVDERPTNENERKRIRSTLELCGLLKTDRNRVEELLFSFTSFWKPEHLSAMLSSGVSFVRGVAFRTGVQVELSLLSDNSKAAEAAATATLAAEAAATATLAAEATATATLAAFETASRDATETKTKTEVMKADTDALLSAALTERKLALLTKFKAFAKRIGVEKVADKNLKAIKWKNLLQLVRQQQKQIGDAERLVAMAPTVNVTGGDGAVAPQPPEHDGEEFTDAESNAKFKLDDPVLAGLPDWDDKYPGVVKVINHDGTYGVVFDVSDGLGVLCVVCCVLCVNVYDAILIYFFVILSVCSGRGSTPSSARGRHCTPVIHE
jgi:hypothetical protein